MGNASQVKGSGQKFRVLLNAVMCVAVIISCGVALAQTYSGLDWNPVKGPPAGAQYVGDKVCAQCHVQEAKTYKSAGMRQGGQRPANAEVLRDHSLLTFQAGPYHYRITREGQKSIYSVTDGKRTISAPILWAFGEPISGQTYVMKYKGAYYQSYATFYTAINALDVTLGAPPTPPKTLEHAFGMPLSNQFAQECISCHTTGAVVGGVFNPKNAMPGVTCEACHGPGGRHVEDLKQGKPAEAAAAIFNPGRLTPYDLVDFCGSCHRTWAQIMRSGLHGLANARFQPYRLELSTCWSATGGELTCLSCHDPHKQYARNIGFYDSKCLACHNEKGMKPVANHPGKACPVGTHDCVKCHMPRYSIPDSHFKFYDHDIRIVRPGAPYPG